MLEKGTALRKSLKIWVMKWILIERVSQYLLLCLKYLFEFNITRFHNKCLMCGEYHTPITIKEIRISSNCRFFCFLTRFIITVSIAKVLLVNRKGQSEAVNRRRTHITMAKRKRTKGQIMIYKTLHIKLKIEQHELHWNRG